MEDLSADDDILSDILLDNLEFEPAISTHKMNPHYRGQRFDRNTVSLLVRRRIVVEKDVATAIEDLCKLGIVRKYLTNKTPRQVTNFHAHARRYFETYLPDSGVEFALTTRYKRVMMEKLAKMPEASEPSPTIKEEASPSIPDESTDNKGKTKPKPRSSLDRASVSIGAAPAASEKADLSVLAMRPFKAGELINYCKGGLKDLSKSEDEALREEATTSREKRKDAEYKGVLGPGRDFSVIRSARKGCSQLLLGPARFVNHDCNPNTDFYRMGSTMLFKVIRPIQRNEEITTYYGDNYFEWANSECMCATCELRGTGAFSTTLPEVKPKEEEPSSSTISTPSETNGRQSARRSVRPTGVAASLHSPSPTPSMTPSWSTTHGDDTPKEKKPKRELLADLKLAEHGPSDDRSVPWAEGAGPKCRCLTCGATFWAPEKWWTPDECPRCERHYKIFKADWPGRVPTEGLLARKAGLKSKPSSELIAEHLASTPTSRPDKQRSLTPTNANTNTPGSQPKKRGRPSKAVSASPRAVSDVASPKSSSKSTHKASAATLPSLSSLGTAKTSGNLVTSSNTSATKSVADNFGLDSDGSDLTPEPDSDRDQVFEDDDDEDEGPRPSSHGTRHEESIRSSSSSPGPAGPKMLGKNAKTDVLAQYWGAPIGDRRVRRKPSTTGGPELLALRQASHEMGGKSAARRSSFRQPDSDSAGQQKLHQRRVVASSASEAEEESVRKASTMHVVKHRKTPSMSDAESMIERNTLPKTASPQLPTAASSPALSPRSSAAQPRSVSRTLASDADRAHERPTEGARPELATSGTERTSESNLALFWSAGVGGPRQRRQAHREPVNVTSSSMPGKRQRQTSDSSRSQTPDIKRSRGRPATDLGTEDDGSSRDRSARSRSAAISDGDKRSSRAGSDMDEDDDDKPLSRPQIANKAQLTTGHVEVAGASEKRGSLLPSAPLFIPPGFPRSDLAAAAARSSSPLAGPPRAGLPGQPMRKNLRWGSGKTSLSRPLGPNNTHGSPLGRPQMSPNGPAGSPLARSESETPAKTQQPFSTASLVNHHQQLHGIPLVADKVMSASEPPESTVGWHTVQEPNVREEVKPPATPLEPSPIQDIYVDAVTGMDIPETVINKHILPVPTSVDLAAPHLSTADEAEVRMEPEEIGNLHSESSAPVEETANAFLEIVNADTFESSSLSTASADPQNRRSSGRARKAPEMAAGQIPYKGSLVRLAAQRAKNPKGSAANSSANSPMSTGTTSPDVWESPKAVRYRKSMADISTPTKQVEDAALLPALGETDSPFAPEHKAVGNGGSTNGLKDTPTSDMHLD